MTEPFDFMSGVDPRQLRALLEGRQSDPFSILGPHSVDGQVVVRVFQPGAFAVQAILPDGSVFDLREGPDGFFSGPLGKDSNLAGRGDYRLRISRPEGVQLAGDPYRYGLLLGELDLYLIAQGTHLDLADCLGSHIVEVEGTSGTRFAVWAPNARRVSVVGDFNAWDGRRNPMRLRPEAGIWEIFLPDVGEGACYKFELLAADGRLLPLKADPLARRMEAPPATASVVTGAGELVWSDSDWMAHRAERQGLDAPLAIYEAHIGSWAERHGEEGSVWQSAGARLIEYAGAMGFTHIELLPVSEHPFGGSWGYQPIGMFAPTARWGGPEDFAGFVDACHRAGLGLILDWVPAHFPSDPHGLVEFDGTALYEHADPRQGLHPDWNTLIYNMGRNEVRNFLLNSALEWTRRYHVDGLRVDAVASMLYLDYSREAGSWIPNQYGGRENLEAVGFLRQLNAMVAEQTPGVMMIAEESTAWPGVTARQEQGGLGFQYKWNMGWMHDTLQYMRQDPVYRRYHHHDMTFGLVYAWSEHFILPLSHDEVVHGKKSLLHKMPGDRWQQFANLRAYYAFMWSHPGKKLLFMGSEFGQDREWNHDAPLDWAALDDAMHAGVLAVVRDLNFLYVESAALHAWDAIPSGFQWLIGDDIDNSVFAFLRRHEEELALVVCNMTPVPRHGYRIGIPRAGRWTERLNTDAACYGGSNMGNGGSVLAQETDAHGQRQSLSLVLPPLSTLILLAQDD
ncbi:1,4-alpha-glucan branching protein GlgB [Eoetvoesiella caeni]|uniref:1,4-alpha-glucan branching enzyme GlgB n=1 Tax=Eoetvoesiella caeni TaxID=645616 RepID=A0A366HJR9_9BURK|nr:1,4-alpha-glucan branching protein GlgB [Eoetvoesiella caeni]MCI2807385.1 1,4-alpha-glucan branching protein GlgB [Eoetvoesiella caeni]RBP43200.1 1,4-alpha-glucan branching enzyme [Eoetvoesiella caeni]